MRVLFKVTLTVADVSFSITLFHRLIPSLLRSPNGIDLATKLLLSGPRTIRGIVPATFDVVLQNRGSTLARDKLLWVLLERAPAVDDLTKFALIREFRDIQERNFYSHKIITLLGC